MGIELPLLCFIILVFSIYAVPIEDSQDSSNIFLNDIREVESEDRSAISTKRRRWPRGIIPYVISRRFTKKERKTIYKAFKMINSTTCIKFYPKTKRNGSYVHFVRGKKNSGCFSNVGRIGNGRQNLNVEPHSFCMNPGAIAHELLHVVGLYHEMSRPDRDDYIKIVKENLQPGVISNWHKHRYSLTYGTKYDYLSLMHYGSRAGSKNGEPTMLNRKGNVVKMGQLKKLRKGDIAIVKGIYRCRG
ncbi:unnamed protein product [Allacma fusca]|uniref:Peptidase M12A domain-containing protein n=1 Tax=Allacma fusca TaxID=39272 RepID=A0A8J2PDS7_9HEXA|nr:unnamed protein product [Allacma fusca]